MIIQVYPQALVGMVTGLISWTQDFAHAALLGSGYSYDAEHVTGADLMDVVATTAVSTPTTTVEGSSVILGGSVTFPAVNSSYSHLVIYTGTSLNSGRLLLDLDTETPVDPAGSAVMIDLDPALGLLRLAVV